MALTIITTCGTSLLQSSCWREAPERLKSIALTPEGERDDMRVRWKNWITGTMESAPEFAERFDKAAWDKVGRLIDLPAELASLRALQLHFDKNKQRVDRIVLLHSTDRDAQFAYQVIRDVFGKEYDVGSAKTKLFGDTRIDEFPCKDLNPQKAENFGRALTQIWKWVSEEKEKANNDDCLILNVTGGFKAMAVVLGGYGYCRGPSLPRVHIVYLYEETSYNQLAFLSFLHDAPEAESIVTGYVDLQSDHQVIKTPMGSPYPF